MDDIINSKSRHHRPRKWLHRDSLILLDLRYGCTKNVHDRYRLTAALTEFGAGEHEQVLAVATHPGCQMVESEERPELVRVLFAEF